MKHLLLLITCALVFAMNLPQRGYALERPIDDAQCNLLNDLLIVDYWNRKINDRMPVTYNHLLHGGYFQMPSARMGAEGEIGAGFSWVPPYHNYNLRVQLTDRLEISGNYRVFRGVEDPLLTPFGFGDLSDKGANFKLSLFQPEDSRYRLPGFAIGAEDFMGTRAFKAWYAVITQVFIDQNLEVSLGYGIHRIKEWFGGVLWMPFRTSGYCFLEGISLAAEYDAIPYKDYSLEPHPKGHKKKSPINFGLKYRLWDQFDLSISYIRGHALAFSASTYYNFGMTKGFLPKFEDPLPYQAPINTEPLGVVRPADVMAQDLIYGFREQGFDILEMRLSYDICGNKILWMEIYNGRYREICEVRSRLNNLLAYLVPWDIDKVTVVMTTDEYFPIQEYHFTMEYVREYGEKKMGPHELKILSPLCEVQFQDKSQSLEIFKTKAPWWNFEIKPKTHFFFGSARGKYKYSVGIYVGFDGFLWDDVYYSVLFGHNFFSKLEHISTIDKLNPSQLPNVQTEIIDYYRQRGLTVDQCYLQKNWNMGRGFYSKLSGGYFQEMYGGVACEFLYYPVNSNWAAGIEGAIVKRRTTSGLGFHNKIRKLEGFIPTYHKFLGTQVFFDLYYHWPEAKLGFIMQLGKFLANDTGVRWEVSRYFPSGLRINLWYTVTNGHDKINGHRYYDKGIGFSMPMDIFYTTSSRDKWNYGMSAWLRDVGYSAYTGEKLYYLIDDQRE